MEANNNEEVDDSVVSDVANSIGKVIKKTRYSDKVKKDADRYVGYANKLHDKARSTMSKGQELEKETVRKAKERIKHNANKKRVVNEAKKRGQAAEKGVRSAVNRVKQNLASTTKLIMKNPMALVVSGVGILLMLVIVCSTASCSMFFGGMNQPAIATSYVAKDADIKEVDAEYSKLEQELQSKVDGVESEKAGMDSYQYDLDQVGHNPYELASFLTVLYEDYDKKKVADTLKTIHERQYSYTENEVVEKRYRMETRYRTVTKYRVQIVNRRPMLVPYQVTESYQEKVEYEYKTLKITLRNNSIDSVVRSWGLKADQMARYELLLQTYGNKEYLFEENVYAMHDLGDYQDYDIPPEYLTDTQFANMINEAEKYLVYPYVWGGSSPDTSFDCSGFVSYVINHCGNGWNVGRLTANGLKNSCVEIAPSEAKPGDLIFFKGTYDTVGASHVGIYVGDGMMIHCGNPIQYASVGSGYWQKHFYCYGRIQ